MHGVLGDVELASLPARTGQHGLARGFQSGVVVRCDELHALQASGDEAFEEGPPMDFRLRERDRDTEDAAAAIVADADCSEYGAIIANAVFTGLFVTRIQEHILEAAERALAPCVEIGIEHRCRAADLRR